MMEVNQSKRAKSVTMVIVICLGLLACITKSESERSNISPQSWWDQRGPVVPHESFPSDCSLCHLGDSWQVIRDDFEYDHLEQTGTELIGAHEKAECLRCHNDRGPVALFAQRGCAGCHEDVHRGQLGMNCQSCHDELGWSPREQIALHNRTRFPLVGAHAATACWRCHIGAGVGNFSPVETDCHSCHAGDLARANNPDHIANGFTVACDRCHIPVTWTGTSFNHPTFPLTGAHAVIDCVDCHAGNVFSGTPTDCFTCHTADYNTASDPEHQMAGFSTACDQCHGTATWEGALFNHVGIANNCSDCHLDDFTATTAPNHTSAGFPISCESCHNTTNWFGAVFNHSFPITNGDHQSLDCTDCHLTPSNFTMFSCTHCHEHRKSEADDEHSDVNGYTWLSSACYACHPNGD